MIFLKFCLILLLTRNSRGLTRLPSSPGETLSLDPKANLAEKNVISKGIVNLKEQSKSSSKDSEQKRTFTVFDLEHQDAVSRPIDLHQPEDCEEVTLTHSPPKTQRMQILMVNHRVPISAYRCQVFVSRIITRCGFDSLSYGSIPAYTDRPYLLTPQACRKTIDQGYLVFERQKVEVTLNVPINHGFFSRGGLEHDHTCISSSFYRANRIWKNSYEFTVLKVHITRIQGKVHPSTNRVIFDNYLVANYKDAMVQDSEMGTFIWTPSEISCDQRVTEIYGGRGHLYSRRNDTKPGSVGDMITFEVPEEERVAGFVIRGESTLCHRSVLNTQLSNVKVIILDWSIIPLNVSLVPKSDLLEIQLHTGWSYVTIKRNLELDARFKLLHGLICDNERSNLYNRLSLLAADNSAALLETFGPGHSVSRSGAVCYVTTGIPVLAKLRPHPNCTMEIPIMVNNVSMFANPLTFTIVRYPQILPCDPIAPVMWLINGRWLKSMPQPSPALSPLRLDPDSNDIELSLPDFTAGLGQGAFTVEQREAHRVYLELYSSRAAVITDITRTALDRAPLVGSLNSFYSSYDLNYLKHSIGYTLVPFFVVFGDYTAFIFGIFWIFVFAKVIGGMLLRCALAYERNGLGLWLLMAVWETMFVVLMTPVRVVNAVAAEAVTPNPRPQSLPTNNARDAPDTPNRRQRFWNWIRRRPNDSVEMPERDQENQRENPGPSSPELYPRDQLESLQNQQEALTSEQIASLMQQLEQALKKTGLTPPSPPRDARTEKRTALSRYQTLTRQLSTIQTTLNILTNNRDQNASGSESEPGDGSVGKERHHPV